MSNKIILKDFKKSIANLEEVLKLKKTDIVRDSAIKRFELCFDLAWKSVKNYAKEQGLECYSPKECFKSAYQLKLIGYEKKWLEIVNDRNLSTHLYKKDQADEIYSKLSKYLKLFEALLIQLEK